MNKDLRNRFIIHKNIIDMILNDEAGLSYGLYKELFDLNSKNIPKGFDKDLYKVQVSYETLEDAIKHLGLLPMTLENNTSDKLLVVDIVTLPSEYKDLKIEDIRNRLEKHYKCNVFLIDSSRQNTQGNINNNCFVYFAN